MRKTHGYCRGRQWRSVWSLTEAAHPKLAVKGGLDLAHRLPHGAELAVADEGDKCGLGALVRVTGRGKEVGGVEEVVVLVDGKDVFDEVAAVLDAGDGQVGAVVVVVHARCADPRGRPGRRRRSEGGVGLSEVGVAGTTKGGEEKSGGDDGAEGEDEGAEGAGLEGLYGRWHVLKGSRGRQRLIRSRDEITPGLPRTGERVQTDRAGKVERTPMSSRGGMRSSRGQAAGEARTTSEGRRARRSEVRGPYTPRPRPI